MNQVAFVRFKASDSVELMGWLSEEAGDTAVVHIHGLSGNGYENYFLDDLRRMYTGAGVSFFAINTRGHGVVSTFWEGGTADAPGLGTKLAGSCYELLEECVHDIQGAVDFLKTRGKTKFIVQGHSLGCTKVVTYMLAKQPAEVLKVVLLAPTDVPAWAGLDPGHAGYLAKAKQLLAQGQPTALVGAQCWENQTPFSAQTYPTLSEAGSAADIYGEREGGALLGRISLPTLIVYGDDDIAIKKIDGTIDHWQARTEQIKHPNTRIAVIPGAPHSYKGFEQQLATTIREFIR